jgi:hypothetical protein
MRFETARIWLKMASALVVIAGLVYALAAWPPTAGLAALLNDLAIWPLDGKQSLADPEARLVAGVLGGVMMGWGTMLWLLIDRLYPRDPTTVRTVILIGLAVWFVIDSVASFVAGAPLNTVLNIVFLALFAIPLLRTAPNRA